jgi:hypothetical protein
MYIELKAILLMPRPENEISTAGREDLLHERLRVPVPIGLSDVQHVAAPGGCAIRQALPGFDKGTFICPTCLFQMPTVLSHSSPQVLTLARDPDSASMPSTAWQAAASEVCKHVHRTRFLVSH